jgi:hypothetical protein
VGRRTRGKLTILNDTVGTIRLLSSKQALACVYPRGWCATDPVFDRIPLSSTGCSLTPQDSSVKSNGRASHYCLFNTVGYQCECRSPSGNLVLAKLTRSIKVWTEVSPTLHPSLRPPTFLHSGRRLQQNYRPISLCAVHLLDAGW